MVETQSSTRHRYSSQILAYLSSEGLSRSLMGHTLVSGSTYLFQSASSNKSSKTLQKHGKMTKKCIMNTILSQISGKDSYDDDAFSSPFNLDD